MTLILALDPGKTTGYAFIQNEPRGCDTIVNQIYTGECNSLSDVSSLLQLLQPAVVICESFKLYPWKAAAQSWGIMPAPEVIGVVKLWCSQHRTTLVMQAPTVKSTAQRKFDISLLCLVGQHRKDAVLHLLYWSYTDGPQWIRDALKMYRK
jgi:hypothetical protein